MIGLYIGITDLVGDIFIRFDQVNASFRPFSTNQGARANSLTGAASAHNRRKPSPGILVESLSNGKRYRYRIAQGGGVGHVPSGQIDRVGKGYTIRPCVELTLLVGDGRQVDRLRFIDRTLTGVKFQFVPPGVGPVKVTSTGSPSARRPYDSSAASNG